MQATCEMEQDHATAFFNTEAMELGFISSVSVVLMKAKEKARKRCANGVVQVMINITQKKPFLEGVVGKKFPPNMSSDRTFREMVK